LGEQLFWTVAQANCLSAYSASLLTKYLKHSREKDTPRIIVHDFLSFPFKLLMAFEKVSNLDNYYWEPEITLGKQILRVVYRKGQLELNWDVTEITNITDAKVIDWEKFVN